MDLAAPFKKCFHLYGKLPVLLPQTGQQNGELKNIFLGEINNILISADFKVLRSVLKQNL